MADEDGRSTYLCPATPMSRGGTRDESLTESAGWYTLQDESLNCFYSKSVQNSKNYASNNIEKLSNRSSEKPQLEFYE